MKYVVLILFTFFVSMVSASSLRVTPTLIEVSEKNHIETLAIANEGDEPILIHGELLYWQQENGHDQYLKTEEVVVLPATFTVEPKQSQLVRVAFLGKADRREGAYRLFLKEIPENKPFAEPGLRIALHISLPVFVKPLEKPFERLHCDYLGNQQGKNLVLKNNGNVHLLINELEILSQNDEVLYHFDNFFKYLLPNQVFLEKMRDHDFIPPSQKLKIKAKVNGQYCIYDVLT